MSTIQVTPSEVLGITSLGDTKASEAAILYGINHRMTHIPVPMNRDNMGYVFFTRPQLNLREQNVRAMRKMLPLLTTEPVSVQRMIRKLLDPRLRNLPCPLVDDKLPFIPVMTNHCLTVSGFPDPFVNSYIAKPGVRKETFGFVDDVIDENHNYTISATFRNMQGSPIALLHYYWMLYQSAVFEATMLPYPDYLVNRIIDYNTRIWRVVVDKTKRYVTHIGCCNAAHVVSSPFGSIFDYDVTHMVNHNLDNITIQYQCFGYTYNDPILIYEFNKLMGIFNPDMRWSTSNIGGLPSGDVVQIPYSELSAFRTQGYPRIDPDTHELQWWVSRLEYQRVQSDYDRISKALAIPQNNLMA